MAPYKSKSMHFRESPPSENTARLRAKLKKLHARQVRAGGRSEPLSLGEVKICGEIISLIRTHFERLAAGEPE